MLIWQTEDIVWGAVSSIDFIEMRPYTSHTWFLYNKLLLEKGRDARIPNSPTRRRLVDALAAFYALLRGSAHRGHTPMGFAVNDAITDVSRERFQKFVVLRAGSRVLFGIRKSALEELAPLTRDPLDLAALLDKRFERDVAMLTDAREVFDTFWRGVTFTATAGLPFLDAAETGELAAWQRELQRYRSSFAPLFTKAVDMRKHWRLTRALVHNIAAARHVSPGLVQKLLGIQIQEVPA